MTEPQPTLDEMIARTSFLRDETRIERPITGVRVSTAHLRHNAPKIAALTRAGVLKGGEALHEGLTEGYLGTIAPR